MVLKYIDDDFDGKRWEEFCHNIYKIRYADVHYTEIPDNYGGDYGIEGFTRSGIVIQCYFPEKKYDDESLHKRYRDKVTQDLKKLLNEKNIQGYKKLGVPDIVEWHFVIPEIRDKRIIEHCNTKKEEILKNIDNYNHLNPEFDIIIKTIQDYKLEISKIMRLSSSKKNLNISKKDIKITTNLKEKHIDNNIHNNIDRKIKAINPQNNDSVILNIFLENYIKYLERKTILQADIPLIYNEILNIEKSYKNQAILKTRLNPISTNNYNIYSEFDESLEKILKDKLEMLDDESVLEIKNGIISSWLGDCSLEFRNNVKVGV